LRVSDGHSAGYELSPEELDVLTRTVGTGRFLTLLHARKGKNRACPVCGWTQRQVKQTGLVGCGACYEAFELD
jgi:protein-arginine kinase activator protein McsA